MTNKICEGISNIFNKLMDAFFIIFCILNFECISTFALPQSKILHKLIYFAFKDTFLISRTSCRFAWRGTLLRGIDCDSTRATSGENKYMKRHGIYSFQLKFNWSTRRRCQIPGKTYYTWVSERTSVCVSVWVYLGACVCAQFTKLCQQTPPRCRPEVEQSKPNLILIRSKMLALHFWFLFLPFFTFRQSLFIFIHVPPEHVCVGVYFCIYHKAHLQNLWGLTRFFSSSSTDETEFLSQP